MWCHGGRWVQRGQCGTGHWKGGNDCSNCPLPSVLISRTDQLADLLSVTSYCNGTENDYRLQRPSTNKPGHRACYDGHCRSGRQSG